MPISYLLSSYLIATVLTRSQIDIDSSLEVPSPTDIDYDLLAISAASLEIDLSLLL